MQFNISTQFIVTLQVLYYIFHVQVMTLCDRWILEICTNMQGRSSRDVWKCNICCQSAEICKSIDVLKYAILNTLKYANNMQTYAYICSNPMSTLGKPEQRSHCMTKSWSMSPQRLGHFLMNAQWASHQIQSSEKWKQRTWNLGQILNLIFWINLKIFMARFVVWLDHGSSNQFRATSDTRTADFSNVTLAHQPWFGAISRSYCGAAQQRAAHVVRLTTGPDGPRARMF